MEETPIFHGLQIFPAIQWTWASLKMGTIKPHNQNFSSRNCCFAPLRPIRQGLKSATKARELYQKAQYRRVGPVGAIVERTRFYGDMLEFGNGKDTCQILIGKSPWKWSRECDSLALYNSIQFEGLADLDPVIFSRFTRSLWEDRSAISS